LSFAKTESAKYQAAVGSLRNAFGGNIGEVMISGKSPSDAATMIDSDMPARPFPIEFLTSEGLLDKKEVNRESDIQLNELKEMLTNYELLESVNVYEMNESILVRLKDRVYFRSGSTGIDEINIEVFERMVKMLKENNWVIMIEGHAQTGESNDTYTLSAQRALAVSKSLTQRGISPDRITTIFYGDSRPQEKVNSKISDRRVDFIIKKADLRQEGRKVDVR